MAILRIKAAEKGACSTNHPPRFGCSRRRLRVYKPSFGSFYCTVRRPTGNPYRISSSIARFQNNMDNMLGGLMKQATAVCTGWCTMVWFQSESPEKTSAARFQNREVGCIIVTAFVLLRTPAVRGVRSICVQKSRKLPFRFPLYP